MKAGLLKWGVTISLVAVLVVVGVFPITSQAAAKGTTYNVMVQKGSPTVSLVSVNGGAPAPNVGQNEGITFQMMVGSKLLTEKVKSTGGTASYYEVTIPKKSFKSPVNEYMAPGGIKLLQASVMTADCKGKLYVSGGDVDVSSVLSKKMTTKIGDGTADPKGSLLILINTVANLTDKSTGKALMKAPQTNYFTTGKSYCIVKGSKSRLEGKAVPNDDTTKSLPTSLVGQPIDLDAGTGTLVGTSGTLNVQNKLFGVTDSMGGQVWVMKITK
jgi:hypothetical protein